MSSVEKLPGIQNPLRIQGLLEGEVSGERYLAERFANPRFLGDAHAMLSRDGPVVFKNPCEKLIQCSIGVRPDFRVIVVFHHEIGVDVAIPSMAKTGDRDAGFLLQLAGEGHQFDELGSRDDDVLVELGQARIAEGK